MGKILTVIFIILILIAVIIITANNLNLKESQDRKVFLKNFSSWILKSGKNIIKIISYAIKLDWNPEKINKTNSS